jgi:hypothetical protein
VEKLTHYIEQIYKVNFGLPLLMKNKIFKFRCAKKELISLCNGNMFHKSRAIAMVTGDYPCGMDVLL